jgi:ergothioneine biosynthesis protein EgtB
VSSAAIEEIAPAATARAHPGEPRRAESLLARYRQVRGFSERLTASLEAEDCVVQSMPDVSPTKWHLAHTSWFFETFVLKKWLPRYRPDVPEYAYLFNSYYNAAGDMHRRDLRGLISRPTLAETRRFRASIDAHIGELINDADDGLLDEIEPVFIIGLHHEQQHQELLVTDIKHVFSQNPLHPIFREREPDTSRLTTPRLSFVAFPETICEIGHAGRSFSYDNEGPRHRALVPAFSLGTRPVTNGEYFAFIEAGGYSKPEFWLSLGWTTVNEQRWQAPLYWEKRDGVWWNFTLSGMRPAENAEPVTHVSYFEADAFANWSGARLPTEFEWERAAANLPIVGNFVDSEQFHPSTASLPNERLTTNESASPNERLTKMYGDVWEWTRSAYLPYPGYRSAAGALGEYNGKFMCNQMVLRGGSCATSQNHIRATYRNFFQPEKRWQFTGIRLARDPA